MSGQDFGRRKSRVMVLRSEAREEVEYLERRLVRARANLAMFDRMWAEVLAEQQEMFNADR